MLNVVLLGYFGNMWLFIHWSIFNFESNTDNNDSTDNSRPVIVSYIKMNEEPSVATAVLQYPDSKAHWAHVGPTWSRQDPRWANVGPTKFAVWIRVVPYHFRHTHIYICLYIYCHVWDIMDWFLGFVVVLIMIVAIDTLKYFFIGIWLPLCQFNNPKWYKQISIY